MALESHTEPEHHIHGVRGRVVQAPGCDLGYASSNLVAHPKAEDFTKLGGKVVVERSNPSATVAQMVEHWPEEPGVGESNPPRGTVVYGFDLGKPGSDQTVEAVIEVLPNGKKRLISVKPYIQPSQA